MPPTPFLFAIRFSFEPSPFFYVYASRALVAEVSSRSGEDRREQNEERRREDYKGQQRREKKQRRGNLREKRGEKRGS